MLRFLFRLVVLAVLVGGAVALYAAYQWDGTSILNRNADAERRDDPVLDADRIREAGGELAVTVARGAERAEAALAEARLTAKIKSKMALDDTIEAGRLNVDTSGTVVTVSGSVDTSAQHDRALQLARETDGVTKVIDEVEVANR